MKFLFCSLDSPGFLYPAIGMARALSARGHEAAFATNETCADTLSGAGSRLFPRGAKGGGSFQVQQWWQPYSIAIQVKHIEYALERFPADVLVGQALTFGPLIVRARRRLPVAMVGFCTYLWPRRDEPVAGERRSKAEELLVWRHDDMLQRLDQACALYRIPVPRQGWRESPLLGDLFLVRSVAALEPAAEDLPERVHLVGSCLWEPEEADPELAAWLARAAASGRPVIYVQHGRFFQLPSFWRELVEALGGSDVWVAASTGRLDSEVGGLPDNFFVRPHVPQRAILQHARVTVSAANTTAALGALTEGVPSLLIPGGGEQPDVAALLASAGVARTLAAGETTPERVREAISALLADSRCRKRAAYFRSEFAKVNGLERTADLLEALARERGPVLRPAGGETPVAGPRSAPRKARSARLSARAPSPA